MSKKYKNDKTKTTISNIEVNLTAGKFVMKSFCAWDGDTLVLNILGTPSAKLDAIGKPKGNQLKVSVTAAPVAGRATDHMVRFLATAFGVTAKDIEVVFGRMNINKQLRIKSPKTLPAFISKHLSQ
ncbi:MAG: DUF167 family protein [Methylotenera sp.]